MGVKALKIHVKIKFDKTRELMSPKYTTLQLRSQKVRKMAEILERTESSYFNSFKILFQDVVNGKSRISF